MQGMEDAYIVEGNVNGDLFERFVTRSLIPILKPFNGINSHSVVIIDKIVEMIAETSWCSPQVSTTLLPRIKPNRTCIFKG